MEGRWALVKVSPTLTTEQSFWRNSKKQQNENYKVDNILLRNNGLDSLAGKKTVITYGFFCTELKFYPWGHKIY